MGSHTGPPLPLPLPPTPPPPAAAAVRAAAAGVPGRGEPGGTRVHPTTPCTTLSSRDSHRASSLCTAGTLGRVVGCMAPPALPAAPGGTSTARPKKCSARTRLLGSLDSSVSATSSRLACVRAMVCTGKAEVGERGGGGGGVVALGGGAASGGGATAAAEVAGSLAERGGGAARCAAAAAVAVGWESWLLCGGSGGGAPAACHDTLALAAAVAPRPPPLAPASMAADTAAERPGVLPPLWLSHTLMMARTASGLRGALLLLLLPPPPPPPLLLRPPSTPTSAPLALLNSSATSESTSAGSL